MTLSGNSNITMSEIQRDSHTSYRIQSSEESVLPSAVYPEYPHSDIPSFREWAFVNLDEFFDTNDLPDLLQPLHPIEQIEPTTRHAGVQNFWRCGGTKPRYFVDKGMLSAGEKAIVLQYHEEPPSSVMDRLRDHNPNITHAYEQIKGAAENERRKKNRREANGPWTGQELEILRQNMQLPPKELMLLLRRTVQGCLKNVDQVRDMKSQIAQKYKGRATDRILNDTESR